MKIPTKVKIKAKTWTLNYDKELLRDDHNYGVCYPTKLKIVLDATQPKDQLENSFFHELIHAIIDSSALRTDLSRDLNEKVAVTIAEDLLHVIRQNNLDFRK